MSASPAPIRRPIPLIFLERISRPLLARLLSDYAPFLETRHGFSVPALAATAQTDRALVAVLWDILSAPPPELVPLHEALDATSDLANTAAHEHLLSRDTARLLDAELSAQDCAVVAYLEHRALFEIARPQVGGSQTKAFASFESKTPRPLPDDPSHDAVFAAAMTDVLDARGRSRHFFTHRWRSGSERHIEIRYGRLPSARDVLTKKEGAAAHEVTAQVTDRSTESAHAIFHDDTMRLDVAGPDWMKELVRRTFGQAYFGSEAHFKGDGTATLAPLANLETALATHGVPGLLRVELQQGWAEFHDKSGWGAFGSKSSCRQGLTGAHTLRVLLDGTPVEAVFFLFLAGRKRPLKLMIVTPSKLVFERRDPRVVRIVRDWVVAAGYMRLPEHLRRDDGDGQALEAGVPASQNGKRRPGDPA